LEKGEKAARAVVNDHAMCCAVIVFIRRNNNVHNSWRSRSASLKLSVRLLHAAEHPLKKENDTPNPGDPTLPSSGPAARHVPVCGDKNKEATYHDVFFPSPFPYPFLCVRSRIFSAVFSEEPRFFFSSHSQRRSWAPGYTGHGLGREKNF
jgi:hypothetical protein